MKSQAMGRGAADMVDQIPIAVALVAAQPMLAMIVQNAVSRHPQVDLQLIAPSGTDLAAFMAHDSLDIVLCEPFDAKDIRRLLHPGQRLLVLGQDTTPLGLLRDILSTRPNQAVDVPSRSPARRAGEEKRRSTEVGINRRNLMAWLLHQQLSDEPDSADTVQPAGRTEEILHLLPHLGSPTTLIFLSMERIRPTSSGWDRLFARVRAALRDEDAVLRLDDTTLVILTALVEPTLTPSLLTRISWRLWPADPLAVTTSSAEWQPGRNIEEVIVAGRRALETAGSLSPRPPVGSRKQPAQRSASAAAPAAEAPTVRSMLSYAGLRKRRSEIEPWCAPLPRMDGEDDLRRAAEMQEEEEFGHRGHGRGVARISVGLAGAMGLTSAQLDEIHTAALLHDGGKIVLDRALWGSRSAITAWQRRLMEAHVTIGSELADRVGLTDAVVGAILHHHERWDGLGYPAHLAGDAIPMSGRILFVAEVVDSMLRESYRRPPLRPRQVAAVLEAGAGRLWDPQVARYAARMIRGTA